MRTVGRIGPTLEAISVWTRSRGTPAAGLDDVRERRIRTLVALGQIVDGVAVDAALLERDPERAAGPRGADKVRQILVEGQGSALERHGFDVPARAVVAGDEPPCDGAISPFVNGHAVDVIVDAVISFPHRQDPPFRIFIAADHAQTRN